MSRSSEEKVLRRWLSWERRCIEKYGRQSPITQAAMRKTEAAIELILQAGKGRDTSAADTGSGV